MTPEREEEIYRLTKENNRMLHKMRRNAFIGGLVKFVLYILVIFVAPYWLYITYLAPMVAQLNDTMTQVQGAGSKAQSQIQNFGDLLKQAQSQLGL